MTQPIIKKDIEDRVKDTGDTMTGTLSIKKGINYNQIYFYDENDMGHCIHTGSNITDDICDFQLQTKTDVGRSLFVLRNKKSTGAEPYCFIYNDINGTSSSQTILTHTNYNKYITAISLLKPTEEISTLSYGKGGWGANVSANDGVIIWRERFIDTSLSTDSGDIVFWLKKNSDTATTLNITIDGFFYQNHSHLLLDDNNYKNYALPLTGGTTTGKIIMKGTNDSSVATANSGILLIGDPAGLHISLDANELMCKNTSTTAGTLYLNNDGGLVQIGSGGLDVAGTLIVRNTHYVNGTIGLRKIGITKGTLPTAVTYWTFNNCDKNGISYSNALGQFETYLGTDGLTKTYIRARQFVVNTASTVKTATLYVQCDINGNMKAGCDAPFYGAVWNDYAEFRKYNDSAEPPYGRVVIENGDDTLSLSTERLQCGGNICSDTFGFAIGETDQCKMPIAVSGRALVYTYEDRNTYQPGEALCTGPNGTVSRMTREEIKEYPDCIIGYVSAIPTYEYWGTGNVEVNGRIWIKVV